MLVDGLTDSSRAGIDDSMEILIAEDDGISRNLLKKTLEQFGHQLRVFENGDDAWADYEASPVRVIVSDWLMPGFDGLEFCRKVRARAEAEYTYFILLTANVQGKETYMEAMESGIDDFMEKPLDRDQIWLRLKVAERILGYTSAIQRLESMLPICSYCKKVRDDNNYWQQVETYLTKHTGASFSHSICPSCYTKMVKPQMEQMKKA